jgi:hypothetical protein
MQRITTTNDDQDDIFVPVQLDAHHAQLSLEETLKNYAQAQMDLFINPPMDVEAVRYRPATGLELIIYPQFLKNGTYANDYTVAGYNTASLYPQSPSMRNSVFLFDYYDSADTAKQRFLFSQVARANEKTCYTLASGVMFPILSISATNRNEFNILYMPRTVTANTVYLKISFFNSLTGKTVVFHRNSGSTAEADLFAAVKLNADKTYSFWDITDSNLTVYESGVFSAIADDAKNAKNIITKPKLDINRGQYQPLANDPEIMRSA